MTRAGLATESRYLLEPHAAQVFPATQQASQGLEYLGATFDKYVLGCRCPASIQRMHDRASLVSLQGAAHRRDEPDMIGPDGNQSAPQQPGKQQQARDGAA